MHREYLDATLRRAATERVHRPAGWSATAIRTYREAIQCIDAATTKADLRAMRSLRMRKRPDLKPGAWSIPLDDELVLILTFKNDGSNATTVLELLDDDGKVRDE